MLGNLFWILIAAVSIGSLTSFDCAPKSIINVVQGAALGASVIGLIHGIAAWGRGSGEGRS